jgi:cytosine/uracil/thiamine/allantoin permease
MGVHSCVCFPVNFLVQLIMYMRKLKYINRITSIAVTIILFAASMFLFEACSKGEDNIGMKENIRINKMNAENKVSRVYGIVTVGLETIISSINMTITVVHETLQITAGVFNGAAENIKSLQSKSGGVELY